MAAAADKDTSRGDKSDTQRSGGVRNPLTLGLAGAVGAVAGIAYLWRPSPEIATAIRIGAAAIGLLLVLRFALAARPAAAPRPAAVVVVSVAASVAVALLAFQTFPLSADEFGYLYAADTLAAGRLWNPPLPEWAADLARTLYIADQPDRRVSQYTPGWPAVLAALGAVGVPAWLAAPLLGGVSGLLLLGSARQLGLPRATSWAVAVLVLLAPFWLFAHGSHFNHALAATAALAVLWLDLRHRRQPGPWSMAGIGLAFAALLATRLDVFAILFPLFALDGLLRHGPRFVLRALPAAAAALPVMVALGLYNHAITGSALTTPMRWTLPDIGMGLWSTGVDGPHSPARAAAYTLRWLTGWLDVASVLVLALYPLALVRRLRAGSAAWWDFALPAAIVFFLFYPDYGGIQHGPRYWFLAHPFVVLTVAVGLADAAGHWRVGRAVLEPRALAVAQAAIFAGFTLGYGAYIRAQADARAGPLRIAAAAPAPAVVLFPDLQQRYVAWQDRLQRLDPADLTRNGIAGVGAVLLASEPADGARLERLCAEAGRPVLRYREDGAPPRGRLEPVC